MELIKGGKDDIFDVTTDKGFNAFLSYLKDEMEREKVMVASPKSMLKFDNLIKNLRYILDQSEEEYTIEIEKCKLFSKKIYVTVKTECFSVPNDYYEFFKDVIDNADGFSSRGLGGQRVEYVFDIADMYSEKK